MNATLPLRTPRPRALRLFNDAPLLGALQRLRYRRFFERAVGVQLFSGVYHSFDEALASAPSSKPQSYDNRASAELYLKRLHIDEYDYPALFWIGDALREGMTSVFDVGGSVGIKYFAFGSVLAWPSGLSWQVQDMPAVAARGREFAQERGAQPTLSFTSDFTDGDGCELLFASGALQYLPFTLGDALRGWRTLPRRIVVNTTPIHPTRSYFTLNNIGSAFCAYRVQAEAEFLGSIQALGYTLRDRWINPGKQLRIPFERGRDVEDYSGFSFDRAA